jgi:hypothetical protein
MSSILISWLGLSLFSPALGHLDPDLAPPHRLSSILRTTSMPSANSCHTGAIQASLRTWIDPIPRSPGGALPPGSISAGTPATPSHSHVLNVELQLHNTSEQAQQVRIAQASWHQTTDTNLFPWTQQPDMSPLNRFSTVQRLPLNLDPSMPVHVTLALSINGQTCSLTASSSTN